MMSQSVLPCNRALISTRCADDNNDIEFLKGDSKSWRNKILTGICGNHWQQMED